MATEYWQKLKKFTQWLVPFLLAVFLLFGCGTPAKSRPAGSSAQIAAAQPAADESRSSADESQPAADESQPAADESQPAAGAQTIDEDGAYTGRDEVALYIHTYGKLPPNYITKKEAEAAGWVSREGNLWEVAPGKSIGGSRYGNYERMLPEKKGRIWYECDIDYDGTYRGAERILYSNDGLIYYTGDHYQTVEQLY